MWHGGKSLSKATPLFWLLSCGKAFVPRCADPADFISTGKRQGIQLHLTDDTSNWNVWNAEHATAKDLSQRSQSAGLHSLFVRNTELGEEKEARVKHLLGKPVAQVLLTCGASSCSCSQESRRHLCTEIRAWKSSHASTIPMSGWDLLALLDEQMCCNWNCVVHPGKNSYQTVSRPPGRVEFVLDLFNNITQHLKHLFHINSRGFKVKNKQGV